MGVIELVLFDRVDLSNESILILNLSKSTESSLLKVRYQANGKKTVMAL